MSCHESITPVAGGFECCQIQWFSKQFSFRFDLSGTEGQAMLTAFGDIFYKLFL